MKCALVTTTINVPTVLELYRQHGPDVAFFVAGDEKTPQVAYDFMLNRDITYFRPENQGHWKCSELIGWNCIQRRNIALLEAIKWGADVIVSVDDDNLCLGRNYFRDFQAILSAQGWEDGFMPLWSGCKVSSPTGWFDVGTLLDPISPHRGFPHAVQSQTVVSHVVGGRVGVAAGICLGDPDIGAVTRMTVHPEVHRVSQLLESGVVVDPETKTVFNSQNTAFLRELAPAMFMMPGVGRYDDIYASLICQRVMRERGLHVHFGKPFVWQQRNPHNLIRDLRQEIDGMENIEKFATELDEWKTTADQSIVNALRFFYSHCKTLPKQSTEAALTFLEDIEGVM